MPIKSRLFRSIWFASLVALLVALGAQLLLESLIPAVAFMWLDGGPGRPEPSYWVAGMSFWRSDSVLRFVVFGLGACVACLLSQALSKSLVAGLVAVSLVAVAFAQFPAKAAAWQLAIWALSGPTASLLVALVFYRKNGDA